MKSEKLGTDEKQANVSSRAHSSLISWASWSRWLGCTCRRKNVVSDWPICEFAASQGVLVMLI
jgi:hypothetical protein